MPLVGIEPALYGLLDAFELPDDLCEQLEAAVKLLGVLQAAVAAAAATGCTASSAAQQKLARFAGDYAQLRMWAGRGRGSKVAEALQKMLKHALADLQEEGQQQHY
jgi:hypothetical protein